MLEYARLWKLESEFIYWLENENTFCNTLVDRIVTGYPKDEAESIFREIGYRDELLDTAEPYHLWAIEGDFEKDLPLQKAGFNVIWTNDIRPYKKMKVRILNGAHTALVFPSLLCGIETVGESLKDEQLNAFYINACLNISCRIFRTPTRRRTLPQLFWNALPIRIFNTYGNLFP